MKNFFARKFSCVSFRTSPTGYVQALSDGAQAEAGLPGALADRTEETQEEKPGETLLQVRD